MVRYGGIESGGTKTVVAVGGPEGVEAEERFPTGDDPRTALGRAAAFLRDHGPVAAVGFGSFGPCDPNPRSATYGHVTTTPKPGWAHTDVVGILRAFGISVPMRFDTDVHAAALAEWRLGVGVGRASLVYVTVGTGIGGGAIIDGHPLHGAMHPEMGHQRISDAPATGICPYHGNCWEGVASGPAIAAREGAAAHTLSPEHPAWEHEADLLANGLANLTLILSPELIVLGGGVGAQAHVHELLRPRLSAAIADYVAVPDVVPPALGGQAGVRGALLLATEATA